mgnify:CR=1 FL=1
MTRKIETAAYIRVSTQEQVLHGISLDAQRSKLKSYADQNGLDIVQWYEDKGVSGRKLIKNRPALQQMISDAEVGKFKHIIFIKLDRFFRSVGEYHECMKRLRDVTWDATEEKYDLTTASGRLLVNSKLMVAEYEADTTGERIKITNDYKVKNGQPTTGSMPWSHTIVRDENGKSKVVPNEKTREQCIEVIDCFLRTNSLNKTLAFCKQYHSFYDIKGLRRWLSNPMLMGTYRNNTSYCEPIISPDKFEQIQSKMKRNIPETKHGGVIFSRLLTCPVCGRKLTGTSWGNRVNGKKYRYVRYRCDRHAKNLGCTYKLVLTQGQIEKCLLDHLEDYIEIKKVEAKFSDAPDVIDTGKLEKRINNLNYMFERDRIGVEEYELKYNALQQQIIDARIPQVSDVSKIEKLDSIIKEGWTSTYEALDTEHRRDFWHAIIKEMQICKNGHDYTIDRIIFN